MGTMRKFFLYLLFGPLSLVPPASWKVVAILALVAFGAKAIHDGWLALDLGVVRVISQPGYLRIDGGVGELALGALALFGAFTLWRHWWGYRHVGPGDDAPVGEL